MLTTAALLREDPESAVRKLIAQSLKDDTFTRYLTIGNPRLLDGTLTELPLSLVQGDIPVEMWPYSGTYHWKYHRLDLRQNLGALKVSFRQEFPIFISEVLELISERTGIVFSQSDVLQGPIMEPGMHEIRANPHSLRWVGSTTLQVIRG